MIKLTRLNNHLVAINPDHIGWADATPDTTLFLIGGDKILVRESLDELIAIIVEYRRQVRMVEPSSDPLGVIEGDPPRIGNVSAARATSTPPGGRASYPPARPSTSSRGSYPPVSQRGRGGV